MKKFLTVVSPLALAGGAVLAAASGSAWLAVLAGFTTGVAVTTNLALYLRPRRASSTNTK